MRSRLTIIVLVLSVLMAGCLCGLDLRPAMQKIDKSLKLIKPEIMTYWNSDQFMEGEPEDEREEFRENRLKHWAELERTVEIALDPEQDGKQRKEEADTEDQD